MQKIIILGSGLIGRAIAGDLNKQHDITVADINPENLKAVENKYGVNTIQLDFTRTEELQHTINPYQLVIGAVPGFMGYKVLKDIIGAGKDVVDISFFPEDAFELNDLALKNNVRAVVDCGVAPGMCNIFAGYHHGRMKISSYECLVGGLPVKREWPFEYKAVFSPIDVIEEYTRPARIIENNAMVVKEALTEIEEIEFEATGTLEAFNTDGLRSLMKTLDGVPNLKEKTLRYPGHAELMRVFRETGFFNKEKISINNKDVSPLDLTTKLLFPKWKMKEGDEDFTIMRVTIKGEENGKEVTYAYDLLDRFDTETGTSSMSRTTGYTCTAVANLLLSGKYQQKGISPPEFVGADEACFQFVIEYLRDRNVKYAVKKRDKFFNDCI